ncbi:type VI secretion system baseplate subunit TssK, partial [Salmonella enterica subsp. enterica serovar Cerro]|nr:type VI secretion system baseplate subunit TssK [Salmonella enterica subsp. enterica serovar Cerro]
RKIESMGVRVHTSKNTQEIVQQGNEARKTMRFADGSELEVDFIVFGILNAVVAPSDLADFSTLVLAIKASMPTDVLLQHFAAQTKIG